MSPWPAEALGGGSSLELIDARWDNDRVGNWAASSAVGGTPGAPNSMSAALPPWPALRLNEILPDNAETNVDETGQPAPWIEIFNTSTETIDLGGMYLSTDFGQYDMWRIPDGTQLCGRLWLLIWADGETADGPYHTSFALDPAGGVVGLFTADGLLIDYLNYGPLPPDVALGRYGDGKSTLLEMNEPTPDEANNGGAAPMILNEYNAVSGGNYLENDGSDVYWGRVIGNGGDWFELVVTQDHLDARGWALIVTDDTGAPNQSTDLLTLSDANVWADLRAGTIITVSEQLPDDVSYDPAGGDWWINVQAASGASGAYITASNFPVSNDEWQLTIRDAVGHAVFGPAGEGVTPISGIGSDEVFKLEEDPGAFIHPHSDYNDGSSSSFAAPNIFAAGTMMQDFTDLRSVLHPCADAGDCADGNLCTQDVCTNGECRNLPITPCYALSWQAVDADSNGVVDACSNALVTVELKLDGVLAPLNGLQVLVDYEPGMLSLVDVEAGSGSGSPWDDAIEVAQVQDDGLLTYGLVLPASASASSAVVARFRFAAQQAGITHLGFNRGCLPRETKLTLAATNKAAPFATGEALALAFVASACDDGNPCTANDVCWDGVCSGEPVDCDDGDDCTVDTCDPLTGCAHTLFDCDADGVCDWDDNCVSVPNAAQMDADSNGWGDACEGVFDSDHDGDVDLADWGHFAGCMTGPNQLPGAGCAAVHDFDTNGSIDLADVAVYQQSFTGATAPVCP